MLFTDGDDIGVYDTYPTDSIVEFIPEYSGTYYITTAFQNGTYTGNWTLGVGEDFGGDYVNSGTATTTTTSTTTPTSVVLNPISGSSADEALAGTSSADEVWGYFGNDTIDGGGGSDIIYGNQGVDRIDGGSGNDTIYAGQNAGVLSGDPQKYRDGTDTVFGGSGDDVIYGNFGIDILSGGDGADRIFGGQDDDIIYGGSGADVIFANIGNDLMIGGSGADTFVGVSGQDTISDFNLAEGDRILQTSQISSTTNGSGGGVINFEDGNTIELVGISASSIDGSYFV